MKLGYKRVYFKSLQSFEKWIAQRKLAYCSNDFQYRMNNYEVQFKVSGKWLKGCWKKSESYLNNTDFFKLTPIYKLVKINEKKNLSINPAKPNRS